MKKYILGLMICMSTFIPSVKVMGTQVSFGKNNQPVNNSHKTEIVCKQKKSTTCTRAQSNLVRVSGAGARCTAKLRCNCKTCQMLEKQKQQKVDKKKHQTTCHCSTYKKQQKDVKTVQPKQTQKHVNQQTTSWRGNTQQPVRK